MSDAHVPWPSSLPIDLVLPEIANALQDRPNIVISAAPGAGKTTRVPPSLLGTPWLSREHPNIILLQPRRIAARAAADRIAAESGWRLGEEVGYHIRFDRRLRPHTRIRVLTEGILTRQLLRDPYLEGIGVVILDEFHERSLDADLALAFLREIQQTVRDDLRIVVMSATLDVQPIVNYLGRTHVVNCPGTLHPIEIHHLDSSAPSPLPQRVLSALIIALEADDCGDLLVFLPGMDEIRRVGREIRTLAEQQDLLVLPLHGSLPAAEQDRALRPSRQRKIVLATNVAETSLTIEGVSTVIDSGLARVAGHDPFRGLDRLKLERISRSSAIQRAGRAGRLGPGRCFRLWGKREERGMAQNETPEVARVDLASSVLAIHGWGAADARRFPWFEPPPDERIEGADRLLSMLGAIGSDRKLTPLGREMLALPVHPRLGRLLIESRRLNILHEGATIAAILSEKDFVKSDRSLPTEMGSSDLVRRLDLFEELVHSRVHSAEIADTSLVRRIASTRDQLLRIMRVDESRSGAADEETMLRLLLLAYPDRVAKRRVSGEAAGVMVGGKGVRMDSRSVVRAWEFFLAIEVRDDPRSERGEARVNMASALRLEWIETAFPDAFEDRRTLEYNREKHRVEAASRRFYHDLLVRENLHLPVERSAAGSVLAEAFKDEARKVLRENEGLARLLDRLEFARSFAPERSWPDVDDESLTKFLELACTGRRSREELVSAPLVSMFQGWLGYSVLQELDAIAPEAVAVPSGNRIRLTYDGTNPPVLAVRVQELFGLRDTPRVALGRIAVRLHLLGPNYRPVQVTDDLPSFWANTYAQVRKDLRARYPKHSWPEDPLSAKAESKGGRRQT